ncbi:HDIG domain-containing protein [Carboxydothermus islandicus]|uniref:HDIG domain-containing protein n=1 Tax=Carboxydothermus islandicus TaxID=661089 RepID=A0A1L8D2V3_9THEO|nr:hypothetical protein [Carboxydothermus islandicus]GAV25411.1 HDIG domain-containing protein [Carboxydothermus islandicus]
MEKKSGKLITNPKDRLGFPLSAKIVFLINVIFTIAAFILLPSRLGDELSLWVFLLIPMFLLPLYLGWSGFWVFLAYIIVVYVAAHLSGNLGVEFHTFLEMFSLISGAFTYCGEQGFYEIVATLGEL